MGTKTISLADDAYEKLKAHKQEGESFSDVVRRLAGGVTLAEFHGVLNEDTADQLEEIVDNRRREYTETHRERVREFADELDG